MNKITSFVKSLFSIENDCVVTETNGFEDYILLCSEIVDLSNISLNKITAETNNLAKEGITLKWQETYDDRFWLIAEKGDEFRVLGLE